MLITCHLDPRLFLAPDLAPGVLLLLKVCTPLKDLHQEWDLGSGTKGAWPTFYLGAPSLLPLRGTKWRGGQAGKRVRGPIWFTGNFILLSSKKTILHATSPPGAPPCSAGRGARKACSGSPTWCPRPKQVYCGPTVPRLGISDTAPTWCPVGLRR